MNEEATKTVCRFCGRGCKSALGLKSHEAACKKKQAGAAGSPTRWPGKCPQCKGALECYARTTSTGLGKRTKYLRCVNRCGFKTQVHEEIHGPLPVPPAHKAPRPREAAAK